MDKKHLVFLFLFAFLIGSIIGYFTVPYACDWVEVFRPVSRSIMSNEFYDPYVGTGFANPSYTFFFTIPFALFEEGISRALWFGFNFACLILFAVLARFEIPAIMVFMASPPVFSTLWDGNIDGLVLLGFVFPPWIGIPLLLIKPQIGVFVVALYAFNVLVRERNPQLFAKQFGPAIFLMLACFFTYDNWFSAMTEINEVASWNLSFWPLGLYIGIFLFAISVLSNSKDLALASAPITSPYISINSFGAIYILLKKDWLVMAVITLTMWSTLLLNW